jgi:hypothetical protein
MHGEEKNKYEDLKVEGKPISEPRKMVRRTKTLWWNNK